MKKLNNKKVAMLVAIAVAASSVAATALNNVEVGAKEGEIQSMANPMLTSSDDWELLKLTNKERLANDLKPLSTNDTFVDAAYVRAEEILDFYAHTRKTADGAMAPYTVLDGVAEEDYAENISRGIAKPADVVTAWMGEAPTTDKKVLSGYANNILDEKNVHAAVGATGLTDGTNTEDFYAQIFLKGDCKPMIKGVVAELEKAPAAYKVGTAVEDMPLALVVECKDHGTSYIPLSAEMCENLDVNKAGVQNVTFKYDDQKYMAELAMYPFDDLDRNNDWFFDWVLTSWSRKTMTGLNETTFGAQQNLVRAQFAVVIHRLAETPDSSIENIFPDVDNGTSGDWYRNAVLWANEKGIITGYSDSGLFGTNDNINREQMAVIMYRYAKAMGYDVSAAADFSKFTDASSVHEFAKEGMAWAVGAGIISGKDNGTKLDPLGNASRAETATIITRFQNYYKLAE